MSFLKKIFCMEAKIMKRMLKESEGDVEAQNGQLYPNQMETPQLRWAFIRKVYCIIFFQLALTAGISAVVINVHQIPNFFTKTYAGLGTFIAIFVVSLLIFIALWFTHKKHPWNYILLILWTISWATLIGLFCSFKNGKIIMLAALLTTVVVVSLTLYTFWAARRGADFAFLGPFLFAASMMLLCFALMQIFLPMGPISRTVFAGLFGILACAYIVYDTDNIIKRLSYDEYILGALSIYMDTCNLYLAILALLSGNK